MRYVTVGDSGCIKEEYIRVFQVDSGTKGFKNNVEDVSQSSRYLDRGVPKEEAVIYKLLISKGISVVLEKTS